MSWPEAFAVTAVAVTTALMVVAIVYFGSRDGGAP